jgi:hypothetical protein
VTRRTRWKKGLSAPDPVLELDAYRQQRFALLGGEDPLKLT